MATSLPNEETRPWQRFTVLDALLLQAGYALAFSVILSPYRRLAFHSFDEGTLVVLAATLMLGNVFSGPIVLGSHWLVRGRRSFPSAGEWLWLSPVVLCGVALFGIWALHWIAQLFPSPKEIRALFYILWGITLALAEIGCLLNAMMILAARSFGDLDHPPCGWTDRFGAWTCLLTGVVLLLCLLAVLGRPGY